MDNDRAQRIRTRAYFIWEREGCPEGGALRHWDQACQEIDREEAEAGTGIAEQSDWQPARAGSGLGQIPGGLADAGETSEFRTRHRTSRGNRAAGRHRAAGWPWGACRNQRAWRSRAARLDAAAGIGTRGRAPERAALAAGRDRADAVASAPRLPDKMPPKAWREDAATDGMADRSGW